jgi:hypothetical protein
MSRRGGMNTVNSKVSWWNLEHATQKLRERMLTAHKHHITVDELYHAFVNPEHVRLFDQVHELGFFKKSNAKYYSNTNLKFTHGDYTIEVDLDRPIPTKEHLLDGAHVVASKLDAWLGAHQEIKHQWKFVTKLLSCLQKNTEINTVAHLRWFMPGSLSLMAEVDAGAVNELREYKPRNIFNVYVPMNLVRACQRANTIIASAQLIEKVDKPELSINATFREEANPLITEYGL